MPIWFFCISSSEKRLGENWTVISPHFCRGQLYCSQACSRPSHKNEVVAAEYLHGVAYHAARSGAVCHKIKLQLVVTVDRVVEFCLAPVDKVEAVFLRQRGYFNNLGHGIDFA